MSNNNEERSKFRIRCTEKAKLPSTFETCPMRLSTLAEEVVNELFKTYKDYAGCHVQGVPAYNGSGLPMITTELFFTPNPRTSEDDIIAFRELQNAKNTSNIAGPIAHMQLIDSQFKRGKKFEITQDGADGIEPFILYSLQKDWQKRCISEIVEKDNYNHNVVYSHVTNIDIIKCIEEFCGTEVMRDDGTMHKVMYAIEMKRPLTNNPSSQADWLVEVITGDIDNFEMVTRDLGMNFSAMSSLNITRV